MCKQKKVLRVGVTQQSIRLHHSLSSSIHPLLCPSPSDVCPLSYSSVCVSFLSFASSRCAFSSNIWVGQRWWIKTRRVCLCACDVLQLCVWCVFDILKQCVCCIHLRQPISACYKSPSVSASHPGSLTGDAVLRRRGVCTRVTVCAGEATSYYANVVLIAAGNVRIGA